MGVFGTRNFLAENISPQDHFARATQLIAQQNFSEAVTELTSALRKDPQFNEARFQLGNLYLNMNRSDAALSAFDRLTDYKKRNIELHRLRALLQLKRYDDIIESTDNAKALESASHLVRAEALAAIGRADDANALYQRILADEQLNTEAMIGLAQNALNRGDRGETRRWLDKVDSIDNANVDAALIVGHLAMASHDYEAAKTAYERAAAIHSNELNAYIGIANAWLALDRPADAARQLAPLPGIPDVVYLRGVAAERGGSTALAATYYNAILKQYPDHFGSLLRLGSHEIMKGNLLTAEMYLRNAVRSTDDNTQALLTLARVERATGQPQHALQTLERALQKDPHSAEGHFQLSLVQASLGQADDARASYQRATELLPQSGQLPITMGRQSLRDGRYKEALAIASAMQQSDSTLTDGLRLEGDVWMAQGEHGSALAAYDRAFESAPDGELLRQRALASIAIGDSQRAAQMLTAWLGDNPDDTEVRSSLAQVYRDSGNLQAAVAAYEKIAAAAGVSARALIELASLYNELGDDRALQTAHRAWEIAPDNLQVGSTYGAMLVDAGDPARGLELIDGALQKSPSEPQLLLYRSLALAQTGDLDASRMQVDVILDSDPDDSVRAIADEILKQIDALEVRE